MTEVDLDKYSVTESERMEHEIFLREARDAGFDTSKINFLWHWVNWIAIRKSIGK